MIIRNEKNQVIGISVQWEGKTYTVNEYSFIGGIGIPGEVLHMAAGEAFHAPEARKFLDRISR